MIVKPVDSSKLRLARDSTETTRTEEFEMFRTLPTLCRMRLYCTEVREEVGTPDSTTEETAVVAVTLTSPGGFEGQMTAPGVRELVPAGQRVQFPAAAFW